MFGFKESAEDGTSPEQLAINLFRDKLQVEVREEEIEIAHRAGKKTPEGHHDPKKARPVLIKFLSLKTKTKRRFKDSQFSVAEDITKENAERVKLLNSMRRNRKNKNV